MKSVRLTEAQRKMYEKEKEYNFRHIARLLCSRSRHTLTASEIISDDSDDSTPSNSNAGPSTSATAAAASESAVRASKLATELASWGEFAEIAHGDIDPGFVLREIDALSEPGYPYHEYYRTLATPGVQCLGVFRGPGKEGVQGYVALRPGVGRAGNDEVIIAFSGTCCVWQVFQDMDVRRTVYSGPSRSHSSSKDPGIQGQHGSSENGKERGNEEPKGDREEKKPRAYVHKGFWRLYTAMRPSMSKVLASALEKHPTADLVITGHSLGGAMCYLLALDVLLKSPELANGNVEGRKITLAAFGCPRVGDAALVKIFNDAATVYRKEYGAENFNEYSVKAFDDGWFSIHFIHIRSCDSY